MAITFVPIYTTTVGSSAVSNIEFTNIPATYTDLCVLYSLRSDRASQVNSSGRISFNGSTSNYSFAGFHTNGSIISDSSDASNSVLIYFPASGATSSTFGNALVYIPNYAGSTKKSYSADCTSETNSATIDVQGVYIGIWADTSAITSIKITEANSANFVQYSTATLYGIKKD